MMRCVVATSLQKDFSVVMNHSWRVASQVCGQEVEFVSVIVVVVVALLRILMNLSSRTGFDQYRAQSLHCRRAYQ